MCVIFQNITISQEKILFIIMQWVKVKTGIFKLFNAKDLQV